MTGPVHRYRTVVRLLYAAIFLLGGVVHLVAGRLDPDGYRVYGETALVPWLTDLWSSFVMPNIGWLTLLLGAFELAVGALLLSGGRRVRPATLALLGFLLFILVLGYGWATSSPMEGFLKNRLGTLVLMALPLPLLRRDTGTPTAGQSRGSGVVS